MLKYIALLLLVLSFSLPVLAGEAIEVLGGNVIIAIALIASLFALFFSLFFYKELMKKSEGTERMKEIASYVREGAYAYLFKQYNIVLKVFGVLFVILVVLAYFGIQNPIVPFAFLTGGFFSGLTGYLGMKTATNASARTAFASMSGLNEGLRVALRSGAVMGLVVVGFGILDIAIWYLILDKVIYSVNHMQNGLSLFGVDFVHQGMDIHSKYTEITTTMLTFGMGASIQALFARVGGGIFTKAADVGADLVGKVEAGIPEDDPRNPATIADNVGDNVGDVAGMGADLYESYCGSILATAALGSALSAPILEKMGMTRESVILAPLLIASIGIFASIISFFLVKTKEGATQKDLLRSLLFGTLGSSVMVLIVVAELASFQIISFSIFWAIVVGLVTGVLIGQMTEYYTSAEYNPVKSIINQAKMGPATTIIDGFANGMYSSGAVVLIISLGILFSFVALDGFHNFFAGVYGIGFAAVGMLSTLGITLATDAYGPIADNAGGNAEMAGLDAKVRERTDALDSLGNTTAATGKGFAIGSAALTAMALLVAYIEEVRIWMARFAGDGIYKVGEYVFSNSLVSDAINIKTATIEDFITAFNLSIMNPKLIVGLFIGAMLTFVFAGMTMKAVGRAAGVMVNEVRRQFLEIKGIMTGEGKPDYARCVEISTMQAQREMLKPAIIAVTAPVLIGILLGVAGVLGLLTGVLTTGFVLAVVLNNAGGAWDNAKKHIEATGAKGSDQHKASVIGDTVGDPFKDTSGPALNILIKLVAMTSIMFVGAVLKFQIFK